MNQQQYAADARDTVVVYDVMRESANRLVARLLNLSKDQGGPIDNDVALERIREVRARVMAVPPRNYDDIVATTRKLRREREALMAR